MNERVEEDGLLHLWANNSSMTGVQTSCQCCRDCCMTYIPADMAEIPISKMWEKSRFQATIEASDCIGCQDCIERCMFDAIEMVKPVAVKGVKGSKKMKAEIIADNCYGCGVCVFACEEIDQDAITMMEVRPPEHIPGPM